MDTAAAPNAHVAGDATLVERARHGDQEAFTTLVDARLATTYRTALALLGNEPDARDATEEIFLRAWRDLPELREPDAFGDWFARIVDDTCRTAVHGPRRAIVRDISPGTAGTPTSGTLRRQIVDRVATTKQHPGPKATQPASSPVRTSRRARLGGILVMALLSLALVILIGQRLQPPETPFRTGLVAFVRDGDVYLAKPDGTEPTAIVHQDGIALSTVVWSPDARRVAIDGDSGAIVFDAATGATTLVGGTSPAWSPDGRQIAVIDQDVPRLRVLDLGTGGTTTHAFEAIGDLAWSPDGRWIVATGSSRDRDSVLVRMNAATGEVVVLDGPSQSSGAASQPAWSPDSLLLAFSQRRSPGFRCRQPLCEADVFTSERDGTSAVQLNEKDTDADQPAWSPDGVWVAFRQAARTTANSPEDPTADPDAMVGLVIASPDLTATRTLVARGVQDFAWSAEGDRLWYVRSEGQGQPPTMWEVPIDGGDGVGRPLGLSIDPPVPGYPRASFGAAWQSLARAAAMPNLPSASPAPSAAIPAFATPPPGPTADPSGSWPALAIETLDGCSPPTLVSTADGSATPVGKPCENDGADSQYAWSPTGILHARLAAGGLSILHLDGREDVNIGELTGLTGFSWSPAGSWLAISGTSDRIVRPDGSGLRELPGPPNWSPDERRLWISRPDGTLLVGAGDGTGLTSVGSFPGWVVWSSDGSRFAFIRGGDVWTAAADGTDARNVTAFPLGGATNMAWSPDGGWLGVATAHGAWMMRPGGSDRRGVAFGRSPSVSNITWAPDSSRLAIETYPDGASGEEIAIYLLNADGSTTIRVDSANAPSWSPDGRYLVVTNIIPSSGGGYESGYLELMNGDGSGRHALPVKTNGNVPVWVRPDR
jgi:Tol biopolymer transport system component/DNA-directed RNA polymerase specialized sigma24 family protein